ncbi:heparinase II/III family protein [Chelativorans sp. AA-79]|uniref:heparinase II/III family protein n=1 Tax=Chelativorans sp. AA-79 TaxID=3028735 RepID=UPI0023F804FD|nr:heparinase II/III family protein [Chelativorans sp. AA-79]WEX11765.1 heparinase II/III family protein [Chelativorans sp. AA-79]
MASGFSPLLWDLAARQAWKRLRRRLRAGPAYRWRYTGRTPERLLLAPPDLRIADAEIAREIYHGRFLLAGHLVETGGQSPFHMDVHNHAWLEELHGFRWLRHLHAAQTDLASANARALVADWITLHGRRIAGIAWQPAVTARRIIAWLQHSAVVLQGADLPAYRQYLKLLAIQVRYLRSVVSEMPDGEEKLRARIALAFASLSFPTSVAAMRAATRNLSAELDHQILPDGGHISRNPRAMMELLADLLPLRQTYGIQAEPPPDALVGAVERMLPALRFFRHQDGSLARFNGMGVTVHDRVAAILRHDDTGGAPLSHAPHSGYERLSMGSTTVIADTAAPPPAELSNMAHAGCLSFELSSGRHQFIVNCGIDSFGAEAFRPLARATAAHSTATLNDTSQARFALPAGWDDWVGTPLVGGPRKVTCRRMDSDGRLGFIASHDGYVSRFGLLHEREFTLMQEGTMVRGSDRFLRPGGAPPEQATAVAVRFHLHPDIELYRDEAGLLILAGESTDTWVFTCEDVEPVVEESIFFAAIAGPSRSRQIVLHFKANALPEVRWQLVRTHSILSRA